MAQRRFAAFDIDGTVIRWQLYHAVADEMARSGILDMTQYQKVRDARMEWKERSHDQAFDTYERKLVNVVNSAIAGIPVDEVKRASASVLAEYKNQVYTFTRDLIRDLKAQDYLVFAISGSQIEIIQPLAEYYGFDDCGGTTYEIKDGAFTGTSIPLRSGRKPEYLKELVAKHNATWEGSIAVGDSESDIPMLSVVEQPIAFNPSRALFDHAKHEHWRVVVERKNMIYELEPKDDSYVLAQTNS